MEQKSNGMIFCFKNKFLNYSETKKFSTERVLTFRELQPLFSYRRVSYKKRRVVGLPKDPSHTKTRTERLFDDCSQMVNLQISLLSGKNF